jgi:prepilin peptidase CpaA
MNLLSIAPHWLAVVVSVLLVGAAVQDIFLRKISNILVMLVMAAAGVAMVAAGPRVDLWQNGAFFAALLAVGTFVHSRGVLGGGDVKLLAATALWTDLKGAPMLLVAVFLSGGILALLMIARVLTRRRGSDQKLRDRRSVPYGVAIAAGTLMILWSERIG